MPNPKPGGPGFFCQGALPLTTKPDYLQVPDTHLSPLLFGYSETVFPGVTTRTCDMQLGGGAYNLVDIARHL